FRAEVELRHSAKPIEHGSGPAFVGITAEASQITQREPSATRHPIQTNDLARVGCGARFFQLCRHSRDELEGNESLGMQLRGAATTSLVIENQALQYFL